MFYYTPEYVKNIRLEEGDLIEIPRKARDNVDERFAKDKTKIRAFVLENYPWHVRCIVLGEDDQYYTSVNKIDIALGNVMVNGKMYQGNQRLLKIMSA